MPADIAFKSIGAAPAHNKEGEAVTAVGVAQGGGPVVYVTVTLA